MLRERPVADISLRELADRVGLAKSNVLRYFDSREAIFIEILDLEWTAWLDELDGLLPAAPPRHGDERATAETVARVVAASLAARPLLCELFGAMASVLERNISVEFARDFKQRAAARSGRLAGQVRAALPRLTEEAAAHFAGAAVVIVAGLWPYANPSHAVATVMEEMGAPDPKRLFTEGLTEGLINQLLGILVRL
jgi:AcrR family transcriptional regulator